MYRLAAGVSAARAGDAATAAAARPRDVPRKARLVLGVVRVLLVLRVVRDLDCMDFSCMDFSLTSP
jgi:hypothetical protein